MLENEAQKQCLAPSDETAGSPAKRKRLLKVNQVADQLSVSQSTVYSLCDRGDIPHLRVGTGRGAIRIDPDDLQRFIDAARVGVQPSTPAKRTSTSGRLFKHLDGDRLRQEWPQQDAGTP